MSDKLDDLVDHMIKNQIHPQEVAAELGGETRLVSTNLEKGEGVVLTCANCGRQARMLIDEKDVPEGKLVLCPTCIHLVERP